jgi:hypothetical protein
MRLPAISGRCRLRRVEKFIKDFRLLCRASGACPHFTNDDRKGGESPLRGTGVDEPAGCPAMVLAQPR